jgi:AcrR family transcriptional regulator
LAEKADRVPASETSIRLYSGRVRLEERVTRRERKKVQTRSALLEAALALIGERGIRGTRVEDVTERADLGKGAFYNYFESKDALVAELLTAGVERFERDYLARLAGGTPPSERVAEIAALHEAFFEEHPEHDLLFQQVRSLTGLDPDLAQAVKPPFRRYLLAIGGALLAPDASEWREEDLLDVAAALAGGIAGYRSFRSAAALAASGTTAEALVLGIPGLVDARRRPT